MPFFGRMKGVFGMRRTRGREQQAVYNDTGCPFDVSNYLLLTMEHTFNSRKCWSQKLLLESDAQNSLEKYPEN